MQKQTQKEWFVADQNDWYGPFSQEDIIILINQKRLSGDSFVCQEGMQEGKLLKDTVLALHLPQNRVSQHKTTFKPAKSVITACSLIMVVSAGVCGFGFYQNQLEQEQRIALAKEQENKTEKVAAQCLEKQEFVSVIQPQIDQFKKEREEERLEQEQPEINQEQQEAMIMAEQPTPTLVPSAQPQSGQTLVTYQKEGARETYTFNVEVEEVPITSFEVYTAPESVNPRGIEVFNEGTPQEYWIDWGNG